MNANMPYGRLRPTHATVVGHFLLIGLIWGTAQAARGYQDVGCGNGVPACDCGGCTGCGCDCVNWWFGGDYLVWQTNGTDLPPLVTTSPATTPLADAGSLDDPNTQIVSGNRDVADDWRNGFRVYGGFYLDPCRRLALVGDYFQTGRDSYDFTGTPDASLIMTRPFFNTETSEDDAELVSVPNELDGTVTVSAYDDFQGAGLGLQQCLWSCGRSCGGCPGASVQVVGGYRYYQYNSGLSITEDLTVLPGTSQPLVPGTQINVHDQFSTRNQFHGGELGLQGRLRQSWWWIDGLAKLAIGGQHRTVRINGQTVNTVPGSGEATFAGGLLTSEVTNIGTYEDDRAVVIPHFRLGVGGQITEMLSVRCGYNVILWDGVAQAASHLPPNLEVDPRNLPPVAAGGGPEPLFPGIQGSNLVAHGFDFGLQLSY